VRSIPSVVDGLKPGHRKILFSCFKRNLKGEVKVAQLSGYIAEHSAYHHGEQSLQTTIVGMAQNHVGSNNINFLEPKGQFGTRLLGGKDAASARYVFTTLSPIARDMFHPSDNHLLEYLDDDGQSIEPRWYVPVVPMVLVNGGEGIGTGWSTFVPNYNPKDIIANIHRLIRKEDLVPMHPWFRGFNGGIVEAGPGKYKVTGIWNKVNDTTLEITELPIGSWTQPYKDFLESLLDDTERMPNGIKDYKEYHTDTTVHFVVTLTAEQMAEAEKEGIEKKFKLATSISTTNMVCFDQEGRIKKYSGPEEILRDFFDLRLEYYNKRKAIPLLALFGVIVPIIVLLLLLLLLLLLSLLFLGIFGWPADKGASHAFQQSQVHLGDH
jgi:DNA topoisomerase-2